MRATTSSAWARRGTRASPASSGASSTPATTPRSSASRSTCRGPRRATGEGQHLDVSQLEAALHFLAPALLDYELTGRVATRAGNRSDHAAPHGAYPCAGDDRWIALSVRGDAEWRALSAVLARPAWLAEARFATHAARVADAEALDALVAEATRSHDASELAGRLQAAGIAAGVVASALDLHADPALAGWGFFQWLEHPARPPAPYEGHALRLGATPGQLRWAAPGLGEHTALVLREVLGLAEEEIARLIDERVAW